MRRPPLAVRLLSVLAGSVGVVLLAEPLRAADDGPTGFVADRECTPCHVGLAASFREVAMSQALAAPRPDNVGGPLGEVFVHEPSGQRYSLFWRDGRLVFRSFVQVGDAAPMHELEIPVDWVLGSGRHAKSYLYRTPGGELYQLPIAWYAESGRWGMAPGFDRPDHDGVTRRVRRECLACHAALPAYESGGDARWAPQRFPEALGEGIGCQRCHGPGAEHVRRAWAGGRPPEEIREAIVNPARLPRERREEVCYQCHLQPSVTLPGIAREGQGDFAFRPGDRLADRRILVEVEEEGLPAADRFEINHHAYRLRRSRCFTASGGRISCLDCHDPHRRPPPAELAARVRSVCLGCHRTLSTSSPTHADVAADCAACHLPKRRAQDVVHAVMTDHGIVRHPPGRDALAPRREREPALVGVELYDPPSGSDRGQGELDRALAVVRLAGGASPAGVERLERLLAARAPASAEPWLDLAYGELGSRRFAAAERAVAAALRRAPDEPQAREWAALARAGQGDREGAIAQLRALLVGGREPRPEAEFNLGRLLLDRGSVDEAILHLQRALDARPNLAAASFHLGRALLGRGETEAGVAALRRALAWDPRHADATVALADFLAARGARTEALSLLRYGTSHARSPERLRRRLAELEGSGNR